MIITGREDRATRGRDPSAHPGAKTEDGGIHEGPASF